MGCNAVFLRPAWMAIVGVAMLLCGPVQAEEPARSGCYASWTAHRDAALRDAALVRFYRFEGLREPASSIDSTGKTLALRLQGVTTPGQRAEHLQLFPGRWPELTAVRLDRGCLLGEPLSGTEKALTVEIWFRQHGPGALRGNNGATDGTLLSVGNGYWDGWRLTVAYPARAIGFEIGRPKPNSSVGIHGGLLADGVWNHLAATWDGHEMRIYLNGMLAGLGDYGGPYTRPARGDGFRIGFAGSGMGSLSLDVDEVAIYRRARSAEEVLQSAYFYAPLAEPVAAQFVAAETELRQRKYAAAAARYDAVLRQPDLHPDYRGLAHLGHSRALCAQQQFAAAAAELGQLCEDRAVAERHRQAALLQTWSLVEKAPGDALPPGVYAKLLKKPDLSASDQRLLHLDLARSLAHAGDYVAAAEEYRKLLQSPPLAPRDGWDLRLEWARLLIEAGDATAARAQYALIVAAGDAPGQYKSDALFSIADSYVRERDFAAAKAALARLSAMADIPPHHRAEATERLREIGRREAGLPPVDPAEHRLELPPAPKPGLTLYVAADGSDAAAGSVRQPFATLERARDEIRARKARGGLPQGGVAVCLGGGEYRRSDSFRLTAQDSGTRQSPVVYRACEGEMARLNGGVRLSGFRAVDDPAVLTRLDPGARGKIVQVDLRGLGVRDFGQAAADNQWPDLYCNGRPMTLARWPKDRFVKMGEMVGNRPFAYNSARTGNREGKFVYEGDHPNRWHGEPDVWLYGYWAWDWADGYQRVASIDTARHVISLAPPNSPYGYRQGQRYYAINLLSELDQPGEWYLDRHAGVLYFYPPVDLGQATVELSLADSLVTLEGAAWVTIQGLTLELGRRDGVVIRGGEHCLVAGCTLRRLGENGVVIQGGTDHGVFGCDLYCLGRGGTRVEGGDRKTLTPGRHFVENCHIYDFSRIYRTYAPAVHLEGCGNRVAHNLFHDSPHQAMRIEGNDHLVEFNEISNVVYESDDQGGVDMFYDPGYRGNVFRYNFWHHIGSGLACGQAGIRLDDIICGVLIYGNVFYRCSHSGFGGVQIHGGKDNIVDNNLFVDCKYAVSFSPWPRERWQKALESPEQVRRLHQVVDITRPPYSTRYPELARLDEDLNVNSVWRNVAIGCGEFFRNDRGRQDTMDNTVASRDCRSDDAGKLDFRGKDGPLAPDRPGFRPIPLEQIGPYPHRLRASWPVERPQPRPVPADTP